MSILSVSNSIPLSLFLIVTYCCDIFLSEFTIFTELREVLLEEDDDEEEDEEEEERELSI